MTNHNRPKECMETVSYASYADINFYRPQQYMWKGYVFTGVCLSTGREVYTSLGRHPQADTLLDRHPQADTPQADTLLGRHPQADTLLGRHPPADTPGRHPLGRHPLGRHHPRQTSHQRATAEDSTHPTGMHSCLV